MSGPIAIEYVLVSALLDLAWGAYQESQQRRAEEAHREQAIANRREHDRRAAVVRREDERRAREAAKRRAEQAAELAVQARSHERRLERARQLAEEARLRFPQVPLDLPATSAPPADPSDPDVLQRYIDEMQASARLIEARVREQAARAAGEQGLQALMTVLENTVAGEPRTVCSTCTPRRSVRFRDRPRPR